MTKRSREVTASESLTPPKRSRRLLEIRTNNERSLSPLSASCFCHGTSPFPPSTPKRGTARAFAEVTTPPKLEKKFYRSSMLTETSNVHRVSALPF